MPLILFALIVFGLTFLYHRKKVDHFATAIQRGIVMAIALSILLLIIVMIAGRLGIFTV